MDHQISLAYFAQLDGYALPFCELISNNIMSVVKSDLEAIRKVPAFGHPSPQVYKNSSSIHAKAQEFCLRKDSMEEQHDLNIKFCALPFFIDNPLIVK